MDPRRRPLVERLPDGARPERPDRGALPLDPRTISVSVNGGFVPNSYKYRADATWLRYEAGRVSVRRDWAQSRSHGNGDTLVAKVRDPGHKSAGRCAKRGGYAYPCER